METGPSSKSSQASIAPFAFLGPQYDDVVRSVATSIGPKDIFHPRNRLKGLASDGMADSRPLAQLVARYITPEILAAIAREYGKGRVLQIGTTDLDAGRAVTWSMGANAASGAPGALGGDVHNEEFNTAYMKRLFDYAYQLSVKGYPWHKAPPGEATPERH